LMGGMSLSENSFARFKTGTYFRISAARNSIFQESISLGEYN